MDHSGSSFSYVKALIDESELPNLVLTRYSLKIKVLKRLDSYHDLNYHVVSVVDGLEYVLKVLNAGDSVCSDKIEAQHEMMSILNDNGIPTPRPICNNLGQLYSVEQLPTVGLTGHTDVNRSYILRLLEYVPGQTLLAAGNPLGVLPDLGRFVGTLDNILKTFAHPWLDEEDSMWSMTKVVDITPLLQQYCTRDVINIGEQIVAAYKERVAPEIPYLQKGTIHGDINNCNILVTKHQCSELPPRTGGNSPVYKIAAIIDFGDACVGYYVFELAICMADLMTSCFAMHKPLEIGKLILQGFTEVFTPNLHEKNVLRLCICIRLLQAYVLGKETLNYSSDNAYVQLEMEETLTLLNQLWAISDDFFYKAMFVTA